nr:MAG TPA: hypothetical protein [Caudoviricetes sp.]
MRIRPSFVNIDNALFLFITPIPSIFILFFSFLRLWRLSFALSVDCIIT